MIDCDEIKYWKYYRTVSQKLIKDIKAYYTDFNKWLEVLGNWLAWRNRGKILSFERCVDSFDYVVSIRLYGVNYLIKVLVCNDGQLLFHIMD